MRDGCCSGKWICPNRTPNSLRCSTCSNPNEVLPSLETCSLHDEGFALPSTRGTQGENHGGQSACDVCCKLALAVRKVSINCPCLPRYRQQSTTIQQVSSRR